MTTSLRRSRGSLKTRSVRPWRAHRTHYEVSPRRMSRRHGDFLPLSRWPEVLSTSPTACGKYPKTEGAPVPSRTQMPSGPASFETDPLSGNTIISTTCTQRRARDSNPDGLAPAGFQDRCISRSANPPKHYHTKTYRASSVPRRKLVLASGLYCPTNTAVPGSVERFFLSRPAVINRKKRRLGHPSASRIANVRAPAISRTPPNKNSRKHPVTQITLRGSSPGMRRTLRNDGIREPCIPNDRSPPAISRRRSPTPGHIAVRDPAIP